MQEYEYRIAFVFCDEYACDEYDFDSLSETDMKKFMETGKIESVKTNAKEGK